MEALLASSLTAAAAQLDGNPEEKVFHIADHVFLGTRFGAADRTLLDSLEVRAVVNITAGATRVPNHFADSGLEYLHLELTDELISNPGQAVPRAYRAIRRWGEENKRVLVHCSAGLSRSATAVLAWLMRDHRLSLKEAKELFESKRGRRPKCNPSFWCYLSLLERELNGWPAGTAPSFDWTPMLVEDMRSMGIKSSARQIEDTLKNESDWVDFWSFYTHLTGGTGIKQLMAAQVVAQQQRPNARAACKAAGFALEIMDVYHALPALQAFALRVLQPLLCHPDERVRQHIFTSGALGKIVAAMQEHPSEPEVQEAGCAALAYLVATSPKLAHEVQFLGGVSCVLSGMRTHFQAEHVQVTGCVSLTILLSSPQCAGAIRAGGGASALLGAMRAHPGASKVQCFGIKGLLALAGQGQAPEDLVSMAGAAELIGQAVLRHPDLRVEGAQALLALQALHARAVKEASVASSSPKRRQWPAVGDRRQGAVLDTLPGA